MNRPWQRFGLRNPWHWAERQRTSQYKETWDMQCLVKWKMGTVSMDSQGRRESGRLAKQKLKEKKAIRHIRRQNGFKKLTLKQDLLKSPEGFPGGSEVKNPPPSAGNMGSIPGLGRSLGGGNGIPPQYSCLENSMDRGSSWATVHGVAESATTETTK